MDGADAPGMSGSPCLEEVKGLSAADLTNRNAIGPQTQGRAHKIGERGNAVFGAQRDKILRFALELASILDQNNPIIRLRHLGKQSIDPGSLAGRCPARDNYVAPLGNGNTEDFGLLRFHDAGIDVVLEREDRDCLLANGECGGSNDRRKQTFEAFAGPRQFGRETRGEAGCTSAPT
jgi:hypothetical protein